MATEIERKFKVINTDYRSQASCSYKIMQGYLSTEPQRTVRVRVKGDRGFITVKGVTHGCERDEWEYEIPVTEAVDMIKKLCQDAVLSKTRYIVEHDGLTWEVDEFHAAHEGLVIAEVELPNADLLITSIPSFVGDEVTGDPRYYNSNLV